MSGRLEARDVARSWSKRDATGQVSFSIEKKEEKNFGQITERNEKCLMIGA